MAARITTVTVLCVLAVVCNVLLPDIFWHSRPRSFGRSAAFVACCALVAEICLLGIWCGMAQQAIKYRLPLTLALVLVTAAAYCIGLQLPDLGQPRSGMPLQVALVICGAAFSQFFVMQVPLWIIRRNHNARIAPTGVMLTEDSLQGKQFSVGYLMLCTAIIAVLLVIVRSALPKQSADIPVRQLTEIFLAILVYVSLSCLLTIPCVWIVLSETIPVHSLMIGLITFVVGPVVALVLTMMIFGRQDADEFFQGVLCYECGLTVTTGATLFILRCAGYRLQPA